MQSAIPARHEPAKPAKQITKRFSLHLLQLQIPELDRITLRFHRNIPPRNVALLVGASIRAIEPNDQSLALGGRFENVPFAGRFHAPFRWVEFDPLWLTIC